MKSLLRKYWNVKLISRKTQALIGVSCACIYIFTRYLLSNNVSYILLIILFASFLLNKKYSLKIKIEHLPIIVSSLVFGCYMLLGYTWTILPHTTFATAVLTLFTICIGLAALDKKLFFEKLPNWILAFSLVEALGILMPLICPSLYFSILSHLPVETVDPALYYISIGRSSGFTPQTTYAGYFTTIGFAVIFNKLLFRDRTKKSGIIYLLMLIFELVALVLTFRRSGILVVVLASLIVLCLNKKVSVINVIKYGGVLIVIGVAAAIFFQDAPVFKKSIERFEIKDDGSDITSGRGYLAEKALNIFEENPIIGVGYGGFNAFYTIGTHNVYLELLCEGGIIGLLLYIPFIMINLVKVVRAIKNKNGDLMLLNLSLFIQIYYVIVCFVENSLTSNFVFLLYILMGALPYAVENTDSCKEGLYNVKFRSSNKQYIED